MKPRPSTTASAGAGIARPDMDDLVARNTRSAADEVDVPLLGFVPGDDVVEVGDAGGFHFVSSKAFSAPASLERKADYLNAIPSPL